MRWLAVICVLGLNGVAPNAVASADWPSIAETSAFAPDASLPDFTQRYQAEGIDVQAGFVPDRTAVTMGEPVVATFFLENGGDRPVHVLIDSWDYNISISAKDESGRDAKPREPQRGGGGLGCCTDVKRGQRLYQAFFLHNFLAPLSPGRYTVTCVRRADSGFMGSNTPEIRTSFSLAVHPADGVELGKCIDRLGAIVRDGTSDDAVIATNALAFISDQRTVPHLLVALKRSEPPSKILIPSMERTALEALGRYPSAELVSVFEGPLFHSPYSGLRSTVAKILGSFNCPRAITLLVRALDDKEDAVRWAAIDSLGRLGDRSVVANLRPFLSCGNADLVLAAIQSLDLLGTSPELSWFDPAFVPQPSGYLVGPAALAIERRWGGKALPYLASKLDIGDPGKKNHFNYVLVRHISLLSGKEFDYRESARDDGTQADRDYNLATMRAIQAKWPLIPGGGTSGAGGE